MGLSISLEIGRSMHENEFAWALAPLGLFGLVHGAHEWFEMCYILTCGVQTPATAWVFLLRLLLLSTSFLLLLLFSFRLIVGREKSRLASKLLLVPVAVWLIGFILIWLLAPGDTASSDVYTRYTLALPGSILAAWGLLRQRERFIRSGLSSFGQDVLLAALAFLVYGLVGQVFSNPSRLFPSTILNATVFEEWFGFPIQLLRAATACMTTVFIVRSLRSFEVEFSQKLETLQAEMLRHVVHAQEAERQRIARELHDETGQTLTALSMGLRGLSETLTARPERAAEKAQKLEVLSTNGLAELQRMVSGLRPPQLDDLGLLPALRWFAHDISERCGLRVIVNSPSRLPDLSPELRTTLYRIAQEAVTNAVRHAQASQINLSISVEHPILTLQIQDNGKGFDVAQTLSTTRDRPCWGLLGMQERARLIGSEFHIDSHPGKGSTVRVLVNLEIVLKPEEAH